MDVDTLSEICLQELAKSTTVAEAIGFIREHSGHEFTTDALYNRFKRRGLRSPSSYLCGGYPGQKRDKELSGWFDIPVDTSDFDTKPDTVHVDIPNKQYEFEPLDCGKELERILLIPDTHRPFHDKRAWATMLKAAKDFRPHTTIFLGDYQDFYSVSAHDRDPRRCHQLADEIKDGDEGMQEVESLGCERVIFHAGNHCDRYSRFLMQNATALLGITSIPQLLKLDERGWKYVPYRQHARLGKLYTTHDVGFSGVNAVRQTGAAFRHSVAFGHCLPITYKVMTANRGPVALSEITTSDIVFSYLNGYVVTSRVRDVTRYKYTGNMVTFSLNSIRQRMTSEHKIFTRDGRYVPISEALKSVNVSDLVARARPISSGTEMPIGDDMLRLCVAYSADAHADHVTNPPQITFHFKKERKIERLTSLVFGAGGALEWSRPSAKGSRKSRKLTKEIRSELNRLVPEKSLPQWMLGLSVRQRQIVIDELEFWDGSVIMDDGVDHGSRQFSSSKCREIDLVRELLLMQGIRSHTVYKKERNIALTYNVKREEFGTKKPLMEFAGFAPVIDLDVGCISTDTKNFFVLTDSGTVELTGNSHRLAVDYFGTVTGDRYVSANLGWLGDSSAADYCHEATKTAWQHGFGTVHMEKSGLFYLNAIPIVDGRCVVDGKIHNVNR